MCLPLTCYIWAAPCKNVSSGIYGQRRTRSDQGLHCPLIESLGTTEGINGEQRPGWYFAHAQNDLNARFAHVRRHFCAWRGPYDLEYEWPKLFQFSRFFRGMDTLTEEITILHCFASLLKRIYSKREASAPVGSKNWVKGGGGGGGRR